MYENTVASVQEVVWQWERRARMTKPTEAEQVKVTWRREQGAECTALYRAAVAKALVALATRISPTMALPNDKHSAIASLR